MSAVLAAVVRRELLRTWRNQTELFHPLLFFVLCVMMFPFAIGSERSLLASIAPGIVWVSALLAASLSLEALFRSDFSDGTLEWLAATGAPLTLIGLGKALAHWMLAGVPVLVLALPLGMLLEVGGGALAVLAASLALGSVTMSLIGTAISALTVGLRGGGMLLAMLLLPMYIPVLIFGAAATANAARALPATAELYFLSGLAVLALTLAPLATAAALRIRLS